MLLSKKRRFGITVCALLILSLHAAAQDWPMFKHDLLRTGCTNASSNYSLAELGLLWKFQTGGAISASPVMADINGDAVLEVIIGSEDGNMYAFSYNGTLLWNFSTAGRIKSTPAVGDINIDNVSDIVFGSDDGILYALNQQGKELWSFETGSPVASSPALKNMDDTPELEIVFGSTNGVVYFLNHNGVMKNNYTTGEAIESSPAIGDVNNDNNDEIVIGSNDNILYILGYPPYKFWQFLTNGDVIPTPVISDYDDDGVTEIILASTNREIMPIYQHSYTGLGGTVRKCTRQGNSTVCTRDTILYTKYSYDWPGEINFTADGEIISSPVVADFDGDGSSEIAFGSVDRSLYIMNESGSKVMRYTTNGQIMSSPAVADLNNDSVLEIIFGSNDKRLYIINYPGGGKWLYQTNGSVRSSPAVADLEGDGSLEIAVGSDDGNVYVFGSKTERDRGYANIYYLKAEQAYDAGDIENVTNYAKMSIDIFSSISDLAGVSKANGILQRLKGDEFYRMAVELYNRSEFTNASASIDKASIIYSNINYATGRVKIEALKERINADTYYIEAKYYYDVGDFENSTAYANRSRSISIGINYSSGILNAERLMNTTDKHIEADRAFVDTINQYYSVGGTEEVKKAMEDARAVYADISYMEGVSSVDKFLSRIDGERFYDVALGFYQNATYDSARKYSQDSVNLFESINYTPGLTKAALLLNKSTTYVQANQHYADAEDYFRATDMISALTYAQTARDLYAEVNDTEGTFKSDLLLNKTREMTKASKGGLVTRAVKMILVLVGIIALLRIRRLRHERKKQESKVEDEIEKPEVKRHTFAERVVEAVREGEPEEVVPLVTAESKDAGIVPTWFYEFREEAFLGFPGLRENPPRFETPKTPVWLINFWAILRRRVKLLVKRPTKLEMPGKREDPLARRLDTIVHTHRRRFIDRLKPGK